MWLSGDHSSLLILNIILLISCQYRWNENLVVVIYGLAWPLHSKSKLVKFCLVVFYPATFFFCRWTSVLGTMPITIELCFLFFTLMFFCSLHWTFSHQIKKKTVNLFTLMTPIYTSQDDTSSSLSFGLPTILYVILYACPPTPLLPWSFISHSLIKDKNALSSMSCFSTLLY